MSKIIKVEVPDIGDFTNVEIIEVLVAPGDAIIQEDALITLESDKATIEIPSPSAGTINEVSVKVGDKVSQGDAILSMEITTASTDKKEDSKSDAEKTPEIDEVKSEEQAPYNIDKKTTTTSGDIHAEIVVLGSGPGGYTAAFRAADLGKQVILIKFHLAPITWSLSGYPEFCYRTTLILPQ